MEKRVQKPVNQKSIYHSFADLYDKIMNDEISIDKADAAARALDGMNKVYANELKRASIEHQIKNATQMINIRTIELKPFSETNATEV